MDKRRRILPWVVLVIVGVAAVVWHWSEPEPSYQGRSLNEWLSRCHESHEDWEFTPDDIEAEKAIRAMGQRTIPILLRMLRTRESMFGHDLYNLVCRQSWLKVRFKPAHENQYEASCGFHALGPEAKSALPDLIRLSMDFKCMWYGNRALACVGAEAIPALRSNLTSEIYGLKSCAAAAVPYLESNAIALLPDLVSCLKDTNGNVRASAAHSLGQIGREPALVVPALVAGLQDPEYGVRGFAAKALGRFGQQPTLLVPLLVARLQDSEPSVRIDAVHALGNFGPAAISAVPAIQRAMVMPGNESVLFQKGAKESLQKIDPTNSAANQP